MKKKNILAIFILAIVVVAFFYLGKKNDHHRLLSLKNLPDTPINKICLKITKPNDAHYCLAVVNQDTSFCRNIDISADKKVCQAMATKDVSYCRAIEKAEAKKMCYYELSFLEGKIDYCGEADDPNDCYFAFIHRLHWESRTDEIKAEYCEKFDSNTPAGLVLRTCCQAFIKQDSSLCQDSKYCLSYFKQPLLFCDTPFKTPNGKTKYKEDCLMDRAMSEKDSTICAKIKEEEMRDMCYGNFSTHISPQVSLCDKITDEMSRNMCYAEVAISLGKD